jgi:hypothetical protein
MTDNKYDIDRLIAYFEMAVKVMGWKNPEQDSYEFHAAEMLKKLRDEKAELQKEIEELVYERDEARVGCALAWARSEFVPSDRVIEDAAIKIARENGWDCFKESTNVKSNT